MNSQKFGTGKIQTAVKAFQSARALTRIGVVGGVSLITVAIITVGMKWGHYRYTHLVLSEAAIKGTITRVGARIDGRIKNIEVQPGQQVYKGDVLLILEDDRLQTELKRAKADVASTKSDLETEKKAIEQLRKRLTIESERIAALRKKTVGELEADQAILARIQKQYNRVEALLKTGAASVAEYDTVTGLRDKAQADLNSGLATLEAADANYEKAMNEMEVLKVRESRLGMLQAHIEVAEAKVAAAQADIDATVVRAPEDGRVLERILEVGSSARVGEPMIALWLGRPWVEAWADERDLKKFKVGSRVDISLDSSRKKKIAGRVESIGLVSDKQLQGAVVPHTLHALRRQNASIPIRVAIEDRAADVQLGLSAVVGIEKISDTSEAEGRTLFSRFLPWGQKTVGQTKQ